MGTICTAHPETAHFRSSVADYTETLIKQEVKALVTPSDLSET